MCFKQGAISTLCGKPLKLVDQFTYLSSNISSPERDVNICITKVWNALDRLLLIWKSDLSGKIKWDFFQVVTVSLLLYGCSSWRLAKDIVKKLYGELDLEFTCYLEILEAALPQNSSCMISFFPSHKTSKQDTLGIAGEVRTNLLHCPVDWGCRIHRLGL